MSTETMLSFLKTCSPEGKIGFQVVTQCAPVLKGVKLSNLITTKPGTWRQVLRHLNGCKVICMLLYADAEMEVLFLYRYEMLEHHLKRNEVRRFLRHCGYESTETKQVLKRLRRRYQQYAGAGREFPHELGVLLGYPVEDVESFIIHEGKNSLMVKYWKVYHNIEHAEQIFRLYDHAKEEALNEIVAGYPLARVAV